MYPSLLTVRFGTVWQNSITYLKSSKARFNVQKHSRALFPCFQNDELHVFEEREIGLSSVKCNGPDKLVSKDQL